MCNPDATNRIAPTRCETWRGMSHLLETIESPNRGELERQQAVALLGDNEVDLSTLSVDDVDFLLIDRHDHAGVLAVKCLCDDSFHSPGVVIDAGAGGSVSGDQFPYRSAARTIRTGQGVQDRWVRRAKGEVHASDVVPNEGFCSGDGVRAGGGGDAGVGGRHAARGWVARRGSGDCRARRRRRDGCARRGWLRGRRARSNEKQGTRTECRHQPVDGSNAGSSGGSRTHAAHAHPLSVLVLQDGCAEPPSGHQPPTRSIEYANDSRPALGVVHRAGDGQDHSKARRLPAEPVPKPPAGGSATASWQLWCVLAGRTCHDVTQLPGRGETAGTEGKRRIARTRRTARDGGPHRPARARRNGQGVAKRPGRGETARTEGKHRIARTRRTARNGGPHRTRQNAPTGPASGPRPASSTDPTGPPMRSAPTTARRRTARTRHTASPSPPVR